MDSRSSVRPGICLSVRPRHDIRRYAHQIFLKLGTKLHLGEKILVCPPRGFFTQKPPFWLKNGLLSLYLRNRASDFDDFSQMLDIIALNDLTSVLCARKFSFAPQGGIYPPKMPPFS